MGKIEILTFVDIETTAIAGPDANTDEIIEIAVCRVSLSDRAVIREWSTLIRPHGPQSRTAIPCKGADDRAWDLGPFHTNAGRFADVDRSQGMNIGDVLRYLTLPLSGATIAGQNPDFDLRYLRRDFARAGIPFPVIDYHRIDLAAPALFLNMAGHVPGLSLRHSAEWAGCPPQEHRALSDVRRTIKVFWAMYDAMILGQWPTCEGIIGGPNVNGAGIQEPQERRDPIQAGHPYEERAVMPGRCWACNGLPGGINHPIGLAGGQAGDPWEKPGANYSP